MTSPSTSSAQRPDSELAASETPDIPGTARAALADAASVTAPESHQVPAPLRRSRVLSVPIVWTAWVIARLVLVYMIYREPQPLGDVYYYHFGVFGDDPTAMTEYPHAGTWPSTLLAWFIGDNVNAYFVAFPLMMFLFDAAFMALLLRRHRITPAAISAAWMWVLFGTAAGHVFALRLDLFPALAVAAAGWALFAYPWLSGAMLAIATAMKLWPGVLAAGLVGRFSSSAAWTRVVVFVASLAGLAGVTIATQGLDRLMSPLTYQSVRGLQIESVAATPFLFKAFHDPQTWDMFFAPSKSIEITGPGVEQAVTLADAAQLIAVGFALLYALYRFIRGRWNPESALAFFVLMILLLIVTNKVFSTQYVTWLAPIVMVALSRGGQPRAQRVVLWLMSILLVTCAGMGTAVYPFHYDALWTRTGSDFLPVLLLAIRNGAVIVMTVLAAIWLGLACRKPVSLRAPRS